MYVEEYVAIVLPSLSDLSLHCIPYHRVIECPPSLFRHRVHVTDVVPCEYIRTQTYTVRLKPSSRNSLEAVDCLVSIVEKLSEWDSGFAAGELGSL